MEKPKFVSKNMPRIDADTPVEPDKAELKMRHNLGMHNIQYVHGAQRPDYKREGRKIRHRQCPFCSFKNNHYLTVCPRCHNCMACGLYNPQATTQTCLFCGNTQPAWTKHHVIIRTVRP